MQRFTELRVWQRAHAAVLQIYRVTQRFPEEERYGLTAQLRRAGVSVPTNIAEGSKRRSRQEYARFLNIAEASLSESEALLLLARDLQFMEGDCADSLILELEEIAKMLCGLREKVERRERA